MPPSRIAALKEFLKGNDIDDIITNRRNLWILSEEFGIPQSLLHEIISEASQTSLFETESEVLTKAESVLEREIKGQVIYLPTYRRIEQDLKNVLPWLNVDKLLDQAARPRARHFIELVEFGMTDVDDQVSKAMKDLNDSFANGLKALTGSYLSEIISGKYKDVRVESLENLDAEAVESVLGRIDEELLPAEDKHRLRSMIREVRSHSQLQLEQKIQAHFMFKLLGLYATQQKKEQNIRLFVEVCNRYLVGKRIAFDSDKY